MCRVNPGGLQYCTLWLSWTLLVIIYLFYLQYEAFFVEWWQYYYEYAKQPMPKKLADFRLEEVDDPTGVFDKFDPANACPKQ